MISIDCFKGLPLEYESFLIERYASFMTTCPYLEIYFPNTEFNYMLVSENSKLVELLIFGNKGNTARCFNSMVDIEQNIVAECTKKLFEEYPVVQKINIALSYKDYSLNKSFLVSRTYDYIINLPTKVADYYVGLGPKNRKSIRNHQKRFLRDYPQAHVITLRGHQIKETVVNKILQLNRDRMKYKGVVPGKDETEIRNIYKFSLHYGYVTYFEIDGVIVAGNISYILNKRIFGHVTAHENSFSLYNLGQLCRLYVFQASIEKGLSTYHLLSGNGEYKIKLLAKPHSLFSYFIYRTFSVEFITSRVKARVWDALITIRQSNFSKPLRDVIKSYRKRRWQKSF